MDDRDDRDADPAEMSRQGRPGGRPQPRQTTSAPEAESGQATDAPAWTAAAPTPPAVDSAGTLNLTAGPAVQVAPPAPSAPAPPLPPARPYGAPQAPGGTGFARFVPNPGELSRRIESVRERRRPVRGGSAVVDAPRVYAHDAVTETIAVPVAVGEQATGAPEASVADEYGESGEGAGEEAAEGAARRRIPAGLVVLTVAVVVAVLVALVVFGRLNVNSPVSTALSPTTTVPAPPPTTAPVTTLPLAEAVQTIVPGTTPYPAAAPADAMMAVLSAAQFANQNALSSVLDPTFDRGQVAALVQALTTQAASLQLTQANIACTENGDTASCGLNPGTGVTLPGNVRFQKNGANWALVGLG